MRKLPRPVAAALLLGAALTPVTLPAVTGAAPACAAATGPHAALVIETGARDLRLCVALDAPSVSGTHLIELASTQEGLSYGFGSGGQAVCRLAGVGPQGDDCFADYPDFWGYWRGDGRGGWTWSSTGAASTSVGDGGLNGWVWGSGDAGTTHTRPPALGIDDVCVPPASPSPSPLRASSPEPSLPAERTTATPGASPSAHRTAPARSPEPTRVATTPDADPSPSLLAAAATDRATPPASGPPGGLLIAIGLGAALAVGGWLRLRAHRRADRSVP